MGKGLKGGSFPLASAALAASQPAVSSATPSLTLHAAERWRMIEGMDMWALLARKPKAEIDEDVIGAYCDKASLIFEAGRHIRKAPRIADSCGIEWHQVPVMED
jgi:hypothetical protein